MDLPTIIIFICIFMAVFNPFATVWAYLDPGTGSMILQLLLGGIAGIAVVFKLYWRRFKNLFKSNSSKWPSSKSSDD